MMEPQRPFGAAARPAATGRVLAIAVMPGRGSMQIA